MRNLDGKVAVVTGGTSALAQYGARVFVTGRSAHNGVANAEQITGIRCDHRVDIEVTAGFERLMCGGRTWKATIRESPEDGDLHR